MKYSQHASVYYASLSDSLKKSIPDSVFLIYGDDPIPSSQESSTCILISDKPETKNIIDLAHMTGIGHIIQPNPKTFSDELEVAARMITQGEAFVKDPIAEILGWDRSLKMPLNEMRWNFTSLQQKEKIKQDISAYVEKWPGGAAVKNEVLLITDELFTNALVHSNENPRSLSELRDFELDDSAPAVIVIAANASKILVAGIDHSGILDTTKLINALWASYQGYRVQSSITSPAGPGLGCRLILNQSLGLYTGVKPFERTVICAQISTDRQSRSTLDTAKNLHLNF